MSEEEPDEGIGRDELDEAEPGEAVDGPPDEPAPDEGVDGDAIDEPVSEADVAGDHIDEPVSEAEVAGDPIEEPVAEAGVAGGPDEFDEPVSAENGPDPAALASELDRLERELYDVRGELSRFEQAVEDRTVKRPKLEAELRRYVRQRMRRNRARGWGPYLVLLYGTILALGAFYFLDGGWAILAMIVVWLSTLGLYVVMVGVGIVFNVLGVPSRVWDAIGRWRS